MNMKIHVKSLGNNVTEIRINENDRILVSYETPVAYIRGSIAVKTSEYWSVTTSRHINQWLTNNGFDLDKVETGEQSLFDELLEFSPETP